MRVVRHHLIAGLRHLTHDDAGRDAGIGHLGRHRHAEALRTKHVDGANADGADEVGHDVADALVAAVDEQGHVRAAALGRRILRDDRALVVVRA